MTASLSVMAVVMVGLLPVHPGAAGAADQRGFQITVSETGFDPPVVEGVNVGDILMFNLGDQTTEQHTVTFEDNSSCPGSRGAVPCWPELRFDDRRPNCQFGNTVLPGRRCMVVQDPGKTVRYHDAFNTAHGGEIRVLGEPTTTTGAVTPPTEPTTTSSTAAPTTTTTAVHTTTTTAPAQIRPFVVPDPPATTSTTMMAVIPVVATSNGTAAPAANKDKDKGKDKPKPKADGVETPTTAASAAPGSMPPDSVFDSESLTPNPVMVPDMPGLPDLGGDGNLESSAVMNLLDHEKPAGDGPVLLAAVALAFLLLAGGVWGFFHRASRYDPA